MSFIEKQEHGGHAYYYLVKNVRVSPTKLRKLRVFIGRKVPARQGLRKYFVELEKKAMERYETRWLPHRLAEKVDDLSASITVFNRQEGAMPKDFLVRYTYNTNAIEGNRLTLRQTALVLSDRIAPEGSSTNDVIEVLNSADAWGFVKGYAGRMDKAFVCRVQYELTKNTSCRVQGAYRDGEVRIIGSRHVPPRHGEVPGLLDALFAEFYSEKRVLHPVELAALFHDRFVGIHPFTDGNGRTSRLLMNWILSRNRFPPVIIEVSNKERYYGAIEAADRGDHGRFAVFLAGQLIAQYTVAVPDQPDAKARGRYAHGRGPEGENEAESRKA